MFTVFSHLASYSHLSHEPFLYRELLPASLVLGCSQWLWMYTYSYMYTTQICQEISQLMSYHIHHHSRTSNHSIKQVQIKFMLKTVHTQRSQNALAVICVHVNILAMANQYQMTSGTWCSLVYHFTVHFFCFCCLWGINQWHRVPSRKMHMT